MTATVLTGGRIRVVAAATCISLVAVACSDDGGDAVSGESPTSSTSVAPTSTEATSDPEPGIVEEVLTPIVASVSTEPTPVRATDGRTYLAYELLVINATTTPATIDSIQALDGETADVLQEYAGDDLVAHARVIGEAEPPATVTLRGGQAALIWLDPSIEDGAAIPTTVAHQLSVTFDEAPNPLLPAEVTETIAVTPVSETPAPLITSPLEGANWFDGNGCCDEVTAHRGSANPINGQYYYAERFAIDWVQLDDQMRIFDGDPTELSSYAYYDAPVYAVADGTVVAVVDDLEDQVPGANPPVGALQVTEFGGNHVVQRFEQNGETYYAFYAHLVPGSPNEYVEVGQQITAGDQVGRLGNSGNSDSPHLHFHVMDTPNPLASNGLPYVFESQDLVGTADGNEALGKAVEGDPLELTPDAPAGLREDEMPLALDVVNLGAAQP